jgi:class 3 adenylate cyclase
MEPQIQYCTTSDGASIAYYVRGTGPTLVATITSWESIRFDSDEVFGRDYYDELAKHFRLVRYDRRGVGLSDLAREDFSLGADVRDLEAVVAAAGLERFVLLGQFHMGPVAIEFAAAHPEQVSQLILYATYARGADLTRKEVQQSLTAMLRSHWGIASRTIVDMVSPGVSGDVLDRMAEHTRASVTGEMAASLLELAYECDVTGHLPQISMPTVIIHRDQDRAVHFGLGRTLAARIPGARLVSLEGRVHWPWIGDTRAVTRVIEEFILGERAQSAAVTAPVPAPGTVRTVLFTDIVGHTEMMQRLGDAKGRDVLREHERITRETLKQHGGAEVKTMGDGFMASFGSVTSAMECAIALQRAFAAWNDGDGAKAASLHVRVGLNAGEPIEEDGDLFGATVILASRIAAKAGAGEILVPDTVRGLLSGKGFIFGDRGDFVPKGFDEGVRLWDVRWQE